MTLLADELNDLKLDGDRQVFLGTDNDLETTTPMETIEQSVAIHAGEVLRPLIGSPATANTMERAQDQVREILNDDPQIASVREVSIDEVDAATNTVTMTVRVLNNNDFTISVTV